MKRFILLFTALPILCISQLTYVPDVNFEQALINYGYDTGTPDGSVPTANISSVTCLAGVWPANCNTSLNNLNISDLTGIEDFTALTILDISYNQITNIDLSQNINLRHLFCYSNQLTSLDLSNNTQLRSLYCAFNSLSSLDLTQNTSLDNLHCSNNQLTSLELSPNTGCYDTLWCDNNLLSSLDLSQNICFTHLNCHDNLLTCLNVQNGSNDTVAGWSNQTYLAAYSNSSLTCIQVDDAAWSTLHWTSIDNQTSFSTNCNYPLGCFSTPTVDWWCIGGVAGYLCIQSATQPSGTLVSGPYNDSLVCSTNCIVTNIIDHENTTNISLFPNPTGDLITLDINGYNGSINVEVFDLSGRLLKSTNNTTISLKDYAKGIYVFRVAYGDIVEVVRVLRQ